MSVVGGSYETLKHALHEQFVLQEWIELKKAEFWARCHERDKKKLPNLASSRRLVSREYPTVEKELQDSLTRDQFTDALEGCEMRMKIRELGPKTLHKAVSHALQIKAMHEAESRVCVV